MKTIIVINLFCLLCLHAYCDGFVWRSKAAFPAVARHRASCFSIGSKGYYGVGHVHSGTLDYQFQDWWEYDPATNSWTQKANHPAFMHGATGFSIGNYGYLAGGISTLGDAFYRYDPVLNIWEQKASCPSWTNGNISFVINNKGYLGLSGYGNNSLYCYNPINDTWTLQSTILPGSIESSVFVLNNKAYYYPAGSLSLYEYDVVTDTYVIKSPFPGTPRKGAVCFALRGIGYIGLGWDGNGNDFKDIFTYDPLTDTWDTIPKKFPGVKRHWVSSYVIGDNAYFGPGASNGTNLNDLWAYEWKVDVGIEEQQKSTSLKLFPNPATDYITVSIKSDFNPQASIKLFQLDGKEVLSEKIENDITNINTSTLSSGVYMCTLINQNNQILASQKLIIN